MNSDTFWSNFGQKQYGNLYHSGNNDRLTKFAEKQHANVHVCISFINWAFEYVFIKHVCVYMRQKEREWRFIHTVITPVAALTPASPNIAVAASVTNAVAPMFTTLNSQMESSKK